MKSLKQLVLPLAFLTGLYACQAKPQKPVESSFQSTNTVRYFNNQEHNMFDLKDIDSDGLVDVVLQVDSITSGKTKTFCAKGYENEVDHIFKPQVMTDELRDSFSRMFKAIKELDYNMASSNYNAAQKK